MEVHVFKDKMWPIHGVSKARHLAFGRPQNTVSWAYMKMMRETNKYMKVYNINPYIEVYQFAKNIYGFLNLNCDGLADVWEYLIIGPEKAMLIDTGFGLGDLNGLCREIIGNKELIVVCTHEGPDHCLGNFRFDQVYCCDIEIEAIKAKCVPGCFDYLFDEDGNNKWLEFDKGDLPVYREYELIGVPNHTVFHLGSGYDIELIWTGGHSGGHAVYLDRTSQFLFAGDIVDSDKAICGQGNHPEFEDCKYRNIETCRDNVALLSRRFDEFKYIFPGHHMVYLENHVLLDILETFNRIMDSPENCDFKSNNGMLYRNVNGFGSIAYRLHGVYAPK